MPARAESTMKERADFAQTLRRHRRTLKVTQKEAAAIADVSVSAYRFAEMGRSLGFKTRRRLEAWMHLTH